MTLAHHLSEPRATRAERRFAYLRCFRVQLCKMLEVVNALLEYAAPEDRVEMEDIAAHFKGMLTEVEERIRTPKAVSRAEIMRKPMKTDWIPMEFGVARDNGWRLPRLLGLLRHSELVACKLRDGIGEWRRERDEDCWNFEIRVIANLRVLAAEPVAAEREAAE